MTILPILTFPNPILKETSKPIEKFDDDLKKLMDDMLETMYADAGVGLAAVQIGVLKRVVVIDTSYKIEDCDGHHDHNHGHDHFRNQKPMFLINPEIVSVSKEKSTYHEGCLSFPEVRADVVRPISVKIKYLDYNKKEQTLEADDLLATCVQH
ncbi:MAG: peptide deformylase, partial [Myxococcota bacterium]